MRNAIQILEESYKALLGAGSNGAAAHVVRISRCLALLRKVLSSSVNRAAPTTRGAAIKLTLKNLQNASTDISVYHNDPVSVIRAKAAEFLKTVPSEVRLIMTGKELKAELCDATPISQMTPTISANATIHILKKPAPLAGAGATSVPSTPEPAQNAPEAIPPIAALLSSEPYFSLFFNLLLLASKNDNTKQAHEVWSLLMDLPHNKDLIQGLQSICAQNGPAAAAAMDVDKPASGTVNWSQLLDPSNAYKLFYSLQIVESLLRPREGANKASAEWSNAFQATGGVRHLVWLLLKAPLTDPAQGFKRFPSATLILDLLSHFVLTKETAPATTAVTSPALPTSPSAVTVPAQSAALASLFEDEFLISSVLTGGAKMDRVEAVRQLKCLLARRLLELGHASVSQEPSNFSSTAAHLAHGAAATATPSQQETQDEANAAAVAPTSALPTPVIASTSDLLFAQIWPFVLALASHSPESMVTSIISSDMEPYWRRLVQVVLLGGCNLDVVRKSVLNAVSAIVAINNDFGYLLENDTPVAKVEPRTKALIFFSGVALDAFTTVNPRAGLPYSQEFFFLLSLFIYSLYTGRIAVQETNASINHISKRLDSLVTTFAQILRNYPVVERRGEATRDVFLIGCLDTLKAVLQCFPDWIFSHASIISGGAVPLLADNPLEVSNENGDKKDNAMDETEDYTIVTSIANLLFRLPSPADSGASAAPACKTADSRSAAFALLLKLVDIDAFVAAEADAKDSSAQLVRLKHIACLLNRFILPRHIGRSAIGGGIRSWAYQPLSVEKASSGYVGLRNLAATCYMNSLMQQFYMVPQFRSRIFSLKPFTAQAPEPGKADSLTDSRNVLFQLQNMFAHLQESQQKYYDPTSFTKVYKGPDGRVMNPLVQMDAEEFFAGLLDKIESVIKSTPDEKAVREFFGGTLCQQVEAKDCGHVSKREEDMLTIPVEVKGKSNLYESLAAFVKADILDGDNKYQCSQCNQMVDARKFACLGRLPDNLVFSLKRFDFDFERLMRVKVNDYFEFPTTLSVEPYTEEGLRRKAKREAEEAAAALAAAAAAEKQSAGDAATGAATTAVEGEIKVEVPDDSYDPADYEYELSGIVIHRGTADSGHYYSYIKDRNSGGADGKAKWYQFNDTAVDPFEEAWIPPLAFGGEDESRRSLKMYSAYMLFYTKIKPVHNHVQARIDEKTLSSSVPPALFANTWVDNASFLLDQQIYEKPYLEFLESLVKKGDTLAKADSHSLSLTQQASVVALTKLNITLIVETLLQMRVKTYLATHMSVLSDMVTSSPLAAKTLLSTFSSNTEHAAYSLGKIFIECPVQELKSQFAAIVGQALITVLKQSLTEENGDSSKDLARLSAASPQLLGNLLPEKSEDCPDFDAPYAVHIGHFIDVWMNLICEHSKNDVSTEDRRDAVTSTLKCLAQVLSVALEDAASRAKMVAYMMPFVHLIMEILEKMPGPEDEEQKKKLKEWRSALKPLVSIIASIVTSSAFDLDSALPGQLIDMSSSETGNVTIVPSGVFDEQALALLPAPLQRAAHQQQHHLGKPQLPKEAWSILTNDTFLSLLLTDSGLANSFNQNTMNICLYLADSHPAWARHLLGLSVGLLKEVSYDRYENIVILIPALFSRLRQLRQVAWDACADVRDRLIAKLSSMDAHSDQRKALDREWAWLLFPGGAIDSDHVNFGEEYLSKNFDDSDGIGLAREGQETLVLVPLLNSARIASLGALIDENSGSAASSGAMEVDGWSILGSTGVVERLRALSQAAQLHAHVAHFVTHKAFPIVLDGKKSWKFASFWALRCLLDCVDTDFAVRAFVGFPSPIFKDWFHHYILFEKCERVRSLAERLYQSVMIGNDARRRIWFSSTDEQILDRLASSSQLNTFLSAVASPILPRRYLPEQIDPLWEERDNLKNATEIMLYSTGVLSLPNASQCDEVNVAIDQDLQKIHVSIAEEVAEEPTRRERPLVLAENLHFTSSLTHASTIQQRSVELMEHLYQRLVEILKTITKGDLTCVDAVKAEKNPSSDWIYKYRMVQSLRLMTWLLMRLPYERRAALQTQTFTECWPNIWMLWKEGVGDPFDNGRTALYAFVDVLSHNFAPILRALAKEPSFMHMNIHVNAEKTVGAFNDRTSGHFFRIILRTMVQLDNDKRAAAGLLASPASVAKFQCVSQPRSVLDIGLIQKIESTNAEDSDAVHDAELLGKLTTMPAWDWAMNWLFIRGLERYPTLCLYLEQLVRLWTKRFPRRDHLVSTTISVQETTQFGIDKFGGASRLLVAATLGSLQPEFYLHPAPETDPLAVPWSEMAGLNLETSMNELESAFSGPFPAVVSADGHSLLNPADGSTSFLNPFRDGTRAMAITDWAGRYPSILPISSLATLELPSKALLHEGVASWLSDIWLLIEQRLTVVSLSLIFGNPAVQFPSLLASFLAHPTSPTSVHRALYDLLLTLRLSLSWVLPYQWVKQGLTAVPAEFASSAPGSHHRPLAPLQVAIFRILRSDETLTKSAEVVISSLTQLQLKDGDKLVSGLCASVLFRDTRLDYSQSQESIALRESLVSLAVDLVEAVTALRPSALDIALNNATQTPHSNFSFVQTIPLSPVAAETQQDGQIPANGAAAATASSFDTKLINLVESSLQQSQAALLVSLARVPNALPESALKASQLSLAIILSLVKTLAQPHETRIPKDLTPPETSSLTALLQTAIATPLVSGPHHNDAGSASERIAILKSQATAAQLTQLIDQLPNKELGAQLRAALKSLLL